MTVLSSCTTEVFNIYDVVISEFTKREKNNFSTTNSFMIQENTKNLKSIVTFLQIWPKRIDQLA